MKKSGAVQVMQTGSIGKELGKSFVDGYNWRLYPEAEKFLVNEVKRFLAGNKFTARLAKRMLNETSTEIFDWIDHMVLPARRVKAEKLIGLGFREEGRLSYGKKVFKIDGSVLFPILLSEEDETELAIKIEDVENFIRVNGVNSEIEGDKLSPYRRARINREGKFLFSAVERRGSNDFVLKNINDKAEYENAIKVFSERKRKFFSEGRGLRKTKKLVLKILKTLSAERSADAFFRCERNYWQSKNKAGRIQYERQNKLGLGWGNHDHHTYRSSRENFAALIEIFELLGYECRERFYAGEKAGWGAQILEHPQCDMVLFADVDITLDEKDKDFAHEGLVHNNQLGTVGLWVGLHGESMLKAGMHHLEARFSFDKLRDDLAKNGIESMKPFSDFKFLRQAFTKGETWSVDKKRAKRLLKDGSITQEQFEGFMKNGAIGSHMENLQRRQGYKGFNQDSVSIIIKATNPLKQMHSEERHA